MIIGGNLYIKKYELKSDRLPPLFNGFKIIFISDLHGKEYGKDNKDFINLIESIKPDCILVGGDMVIGSKGVKQSSSEISTDVSEMENLLFTCDNKLKDNSAYYGISENSINISIKLLEQLSEKYTVLHALGNHEEKLRPLLYKEYMEKLSKLSIKLLNNDAFTFERSNEKIKIYGLTLGLEFYPKFKKKTLPSEFINEKIGIKTDEFSILLAHSPCYFKNYAKWGADLVLSGHLHGGIMRLPYIGGVIGPDFFLFPKYSGGIYKKDESTMIVSCGAGTHTINLRIFNPPEITLIELKSGEI